MDKDERVRAMETKRVALITGSSKGIGKGIAQALAKQGVAVVVTSRQLSDAQRLATEIQEEGGSALGLEFDIESQPHLSLIIQHTIEHFGRLDILVNNAVNQHCLLPSMDFSDEETIKTITTNLSHNYLLSQKAYPYLQAHQGCIINIASVVANQHLLGLPLYGLVKGGIVQMTKVLAAEWANSKVRVNAINPGFIRTQAFVDLGFEAEVIDRAYGFYDSYQPLSGVGQPDDVANAVLFLSNEASSFMTGAVLDVDGGFSVKALELYSGS